MKVLVTGAAGFLGRRLVAALLGGVPGLPPVERLVAVDIAAGAARHARLEWKTGSVADERFARSLVEGGVDVVFHLAAVLSGQSEAEFDFGLQVNFDATRSLLDACRRLTTPPRFVFTSTIAVFGGALPAVVTDDTAVTPQSSYGAAKAMAEVLVAEYARRGFVDGLALRLPTVAIRPGVPNSAMSSFVSGIVREPLAGLESVCPVPLDTPLWISSPGVLTRNLLQGARLHADALQGRRAVNLPGLTVTPGEMLDSLERLAGAEARARVRCRPDEHIMRVVCTWPGAFDVTRALRLGFERDAAIDAVVRQFIEEQRITP